MERLWNEGIAIINRVLEFTNKKDNLVTPVCFQPSAPDASRLMAALNREASDFFSWYRIEYHELVSASSGDLDPSWDEVRDSHRCQSRLGLLMDGLAINDIIDTCESHAFKSLTYQVTFLNEQPERYLKSG